MPRARRVVGQAPPPAEPFFGSASGGACETMTGEGACPTTLSGGASLTTRRVAAAVCALAAAVFAAAPPELESISPLAVRPGAATELKFSGTGLAEATNVWASFSAKFDSLGDGKFRVQVPSDAPVGVGIVRLFGARGVSRLRFVFIDDLPTVAESKTNKTRESAQSVPFGTAVEGHVDELGYDWFRVVAGKGRRIAIEVVATRLGSRLDSVLRVFDADGKQIAQNDDAPGLRGDSFIAFTAPAAGLYFIELRDVTYSGGSETFYRMRVGDFPLATAVYPAAVSRGAEATLRLVGPTGQIGRVEARPTESAVFPVSVRGARGSSFAKALVSPLREITEREPNDSFTKATRAAWTNGLNGRFDKPGDRDCYSFNVRRGDRLEFRAATRSLGSPCDAVLEIASVDGKTLARSNPTAADEGIVAHQFAADGTYQLIVEEAVGAFGANCVYRITAARAPGFSLSLDADRFNAAPGKSFDVKVSIARGDFKGAVTLALEGVESLQWTNNVIADGKTNATMKVTVPAGFLPGAPQFFSVVGRAARDGHEVQGRASTAAMLRRQFPQMLCVPPELDGEVVLGITAP